MRNNFSATRMRAITRNQEVKYDLLSREIMELDILAEAVKERSSEKEDFFDGRVATPYGVSSHVHIPRIDAAGAPWTVWR